MPPRRYVILVYNGKDFAQMGDYWNGSTYDLTAAHVYFGISASILVRKRLKILQIVNFIKAQPIKLLMQ